MKMKSIVHTINAGLVVFFCLSASTALAHHKPPTPTPTPAPAPTATAASTSSAHADANAAAVAGASAVGNGGSASAAVGDVSNVATGGEGGAGGNGGNADASNAGNSLTVTTNEKRQAPALGQGSLYVGDCGAGVNGGGSGGGGAGFLGIVWTPDDCKLLKAAQAYQALGMVDAACEMVNGISSVKARWKELKLDPPKCAVAPVDATPAAPPVAFVPEATKADLSNYATKDDLNKAFRAAVGK